MNIPIVVSYQLDIENNFNLNDTNTYGIKYKIYLLSLKYENNIDEYNKKLKIITYNIDDCMNNKLIVEIFIYCDLILKSILINNRLKNINDISDENISKINNIFIQISTYLTNENFDLIIKFIFQIIDFNYKFNQQCIKYKQKYSKIIIKEKTLILFIKNCFIQLNDFSLKEQLINKIIFNGRELNQNNSKFTHKKEYIMEKPFLTAILLKNLSDIKDYKSVCLIFNYLNEITNYSTINTKLLLIFNLLSIITQLILDLYKDKLKINENDNIYEECFNTGSILINKLLQFTTQSKLIKYLRDIFKIFYGTLSENKNNKIKAIIMRLFLLLKDNILYPLSKQNQYFQYLSLSKTVYLNPYIYNIFYINNLTIKEPIIQYNVDIRINTYNTIDNFYIANFINEDSKQSLFFYINQKKELIIGEKILNKNQVNQLHIYKDINDFILDDNNFHNISITIDLQKKIINLLINNKKLIQFHNISFNDFNCEHLCIIIGYNYATVNSFINKNIEPSSIIDISNIMVLNYKNEFDSYYLNKQIELVKKKNEIDNLLENLFIEKKEGYYAYVLADINFNLNNIKIIKSNKLINKFSILDIFNKYLYVNNEIQNKYISTIEFWNPFVEKEKIQLFMTSINDNIEKYYCANKVFEIQNINKIGLSNNIFDNFNLWSNTANYFFIDFLIGFLYGIDKRREYYDKKNKENFEVNNNSNLLEEDDEYICEFILLILEIILIIPNEKIKLFFLYENNYIDIKLKYFFKRNIHLLNSKDFLNKIINILKNKKEDLLIFINEIFIDIIIFPLLNLENQNTILKVIKLLLEEKKEIVKNNTKNNSEKDRMDQEEVINPLLYKLLEKLFNIISYYGLSIVDIKELNNEKQKDIIIKCIILIYEKMDKKNNEKYIKKIADLSRNILNNSATFLENFQTHNIKSFLEEYKNKNIIQRNTVFFDNCNIHSQIESITKSITLYLAKSSEKQIEDNVNENINETNNNNNNNDNEIDNYKIYYVIQKNDSLHDNDGDINENNNIDIIENDDEQNENNLNVLNDKKCFFCHYLCTYFQLQLKSIYDEIKYERYKKKFYRNLFINFDELKPILGINNYAWYLSDNESCHKTQNKFFVKENKIIIDKDDMKKTKNNLLSYKYNNDLDIYNKIVVQLHGIFIYDKISLNHHFLRLFDNNINNDNNNVIFENCLLINKIHKTISLLLIYNEYLLIITNICVDGDHRLHVAVNELNMNVWCIEYEEYISELNNYIIENEKEILKKYNDENEKNDFIKGFGYNRNYKFQIKRINFSEINEIHKVPFLQIQNSIEITTNKGKVFFLCFIRERRDNIFVQLINKITNIYSNVKKIKSFAKKIKQNQNSDDYFYMKHCPKFYLDSIKDNNIFSLLGKKIITNKKKINDIYRKAIVNKNIFLTEVNGLWLKNRISNFDYLMLLNTFSGRSLINLFQYFIFPVILQDFDHKIINLVNKTMYRDLSVPIFACYHSLNGNLSKLDIKNFDISDIGNQYHSGVFYSAHAFVSYFSIRQHPFTEVHLEIQGGAFDQADRLFIGTNDLSLLKDKNQELIPFIYTLPEIYINTNNFIFGKLIQKDSSGIVNDFILPKWSEDDPRKFTLIFKKILESPKISQNLNYWIDLIFGYKMNGIEAIKSYNTFRRACYELSNEEIIKMNKNGELLTILLEKQELGYMGKQLFKKAHKKREIITDECQENIFFDTNIKLRKIKSIKLNNKDEDNNENKKINYLMVETNNDYINDTINNINFYHQGGVSSLKTIMNSLSNDSFNKNINTKKDMMKLVNAFEKECKFNILDKKTLYLGDPKNNIILQYNKRIIKIKYNINDSSYYCINEIGNISKIVANQKGTKLYIGFDNGNIKVYKILFIDVMSEFTSDSNFIYPFKNYYENIVNARKKLNGSFKTKRTDFTYKNINANNNNNNNINLNNIFEFLIFEKIQNNSFTNNNPHIPQKIKKLCLDEENNILIASTTFNTIYIISLSNNLKLMHVVPYFTKEYYNYQYKIKDIISLNNNGEFLVYSSLTVHLFSINGIPICDLNLLSKEYNHISNITYCYAVFLFDVILFTGHKDGTLNIWKVENRTKSDFSNERASYKSSNKNIKFLHEYNFGYSFNNDLSNMKDYQLKRRFEIVSNITIDINIPIKFMKMSNDMSYMILINKNKNIFILSYFEEENNKNIISNNDNSSKKKKIICSSCGKSIIDSFYRATTIKCFNNFENDNTFSKDYEIIDTRNYSNINEDLENNKKEGDKKGRDISYICEECKQRLVHIENYLYKY